MIDLDTNNKYILLTRWHFVTEATGDILVKYTERNIFPTSMFSLMESRKNSGKYAKNMHHLPKEMKMASANSSCLIKYKIIIKTAKCRGESSWK